MLEKLYDAVSNGLLSECFTHQDFMKWVKGNNITNNGKPYSQTYLNGFLSSSSLDSTSTKTDKALYQFKGNPTYYSFKKNGCKHKEIK
ncbi:hypothetical protein JCM39194_22140 [Desulfotomaculum varum]